MFAQDITYEKDGDTMKVASVFCILSAFVHLLRRRTALSTPASIRSLWNSVARRLLPRLQPRRWAES